MSARPVSAVLVNPLPGGSGINEATVEPPLGLAYIAAVLEREGHGVAIVDANVLRLDAAQVLERIPSGADLVGVHVNSFSFDAAAELCRLVRERDPETTLVLGGPLPTATPLVLLDEIDCDGIIRGEGEASVARMMDNLAAGRPAFDAEVHGAVFHNANGDLVEVEPHRITELDSLPFPAYHLLPPLTAYRGRSRKRPVAAIVTSRGCSHECIFCSKDIFKRRVTFRSPENVLAEIDHLVRDLGARQIDVLDDNFVQNRKRVDAILDGIIERGYGLAINMQSGIRAEQVDEDLLRKMKKAGVFRLSFGVESADPEVLRICRKRLDLDRIRSVVHTAKRLGFDVGGFFIVGLPGETEEAFRATMDFARSAGFDIANFTIAVPFVGTELYRMVEDGGEFLVDTTRNISGGFYARRAFYTYGDMTPEDVVRRWESAYDEFYSWPHRLRILLNIRSISELQWLAEAAASVVKSKLA